MTGGEETRETEPDLSRLLRTFRRDAGLTQEELAESAGVSARTISDAERGLRTSIYRDTAERLALALGLAPAQARLFEVAARKGARRGPDPKALNQRAGQTLPLPSNTLVGRDRELDVILDALGDQNVRLLTLTGPGGIGKTRLAIESGHRAAEQGLQVFFVPLSSVQDPDLVPSTVAVSIGVTSIEESEVFGIVELIGDSETLLVLDTFEHVIPAVQMVMDMLSLCPRLKILVTSRERLHLSPEHEILIPTLELPPQQPSLDEVLELPATRLFLDRARAVKGDMVLDRRSAGIVRDICGRLDGLPLALELAAARVKHLSLEDLRKHLETSLSVLSGGPRDLPRRQQTMRDAVAWSYDLLTSKEQRFFRSLSGFSGGWTLEAASEVSEEGPNTLDHIGALVDKSLVVLSRDEHARYSLLDVIREFSIEMTRSEGETEGLRQRHSAFFLRFAQRAEPEMHGPAQKEWFQRIELEHDNLRAALSWSLEQGDADAALGLAGSLWQFWRRQGHVSEGRMWLREALAIAQTESHGLRAKALWGAGWLAFVQGDFDAGQQLSSELIEIAQRENLPLEERNGLTVRGQIALSLGRFDEALRSFESALDLCPAIPERWILATSLLNLGTAKMHAGDLDGAEAMISQARDIYVEIGDNNFAYRSTGYLGFTSMLAGDIPLAEARFSQHLEGAAAVDDLQGVAESFEGLAAVNAMKRKREASLKSAKLSGAAAALRDRLTFKQYPHDRAGMDRVLDIAKEMLGAASWQKSFDEGMRLSLDEALTLALGTM